MINFVIGFVFCLAVAWYYQREQQRLYDRLYLDFLKLIDGASVRSGGRAVFKGERAVTLNVPTADKGEYRIMTPSMAEYEAIEQDERDGRSSLDDIDMEHLRRTGVIN